MEGNEKFAVQDIEECARRMRATKVIIDDLMAKGLEVSPEREEELRAPIYDWVSSHFTFDEYFDTFDDEGSGGIFASDYGRELLSKVFEGGWDEFQDYLTAIHKTQVR